MPFFTPLPVSFAAVFVASAVLSAAFSVASPVFTAAFLVTCAVFFAVVLVACPVSSAAFFMSSPAWPNENAVSASSAPASIKENFVFIVPPLELLRVPSAANLYQSRQTRAIAASTRHCPDLGHPRKQPTCMASAFQNTRPQASEVPFSSSVIVSSSTSHFFRIAKMVFDPNPARISWRKMRVVCFWSLSFGFCNLLRRR